MSKYKYWISHSFIESFSTNIELLYVAEDFFLIITLYWVVQKVRAAKDLNLINEIKNLNLLRFNFPSKSARTFRTTQYIPIAETSETKYIYSAIERRWFNYDARIRRQSELFIRLTSTLTKSIFDVDAIARSIVRHRINFMTSWCQRPSPQFNRSSLMPRDLEITQRLCKRWDLQYKGIYRLQWFNRYL